jgi:hypothetical protein
VTEYDATVDSALTDLIGSLANIAGFDPVGNKKWYGEKMPNVIGHRDVDYTYCPGESVYSQLDAIRAAASSTYNSLQSASQPLQAQWVSANVAESYLTTDQPTVTFNYTNVGSTAWRSTTTALQLSVAETGQRQRVDLPVTMSVSESTALTATLDILPKRTGTYTLVSKLYRKGQVVPGSSHRYTITVTATYAADTPTLTLPLAIQQGWAPQLSFSAQNSGLADWPATTKIMLNGEKLATLGQITSAGQTVERQVAYEAAANLASGQYSVKIELRLPNGQTIAGSRTSQSLRVD